MDHLEAYIRIDKLSSSSDEFRSITSKVIYRNSLRLRAHTVGSMVSNVDMLEIPVSNTPKPQTLKP